MANKTSDQWQTKRFLLTFDYKHYDPVMGAEFWPKQIYFKMWFPVRERNKNITSQIKL